MEKVSVNSLADFEFKHIPQQEFEKIVMKVRERKAKDAWASYCLEQDEAVKIAKVKVAKVSDDYESEPEEGNFRAPAPLLGPARKMDISMFRSERKVMKPSSRESSSSASTVHIEDVVESKPSQIKVRELRRVDDDASCNSSGSCDEKSLHNEMMKLCYEIESANGGKASDNDDSSVDLSFQEERHLRNIMDKTEEKVICETYGQNIDKKFDFLNDEFKNSEHEDCGAVKKAQTLPAVELKPKNKKIPPENGGDFSNDNNVWRPKAENQIRRTDVRQRGNTKKNDNDVFPSDVIMAKARDVGKLKPVANEKPRDDVERVERRQEEVFPSKCDILAALGGIKEYQRRICQYIDFLREIVEDPPEIEDMDDLKRRQKRAVEFSNRFARNHLYQIGRIAEEIRLMPDNPLDVATKVNGLFQIITQAIQIYLKNVEMFIYNSYPDKLLVLVDFVINSVKICLDRMVFDKRDAVVNQMLRKCGALREFLEMNKQSFARFASIAEQRKKSIHSRSSFAFEVPQSSKFSMYGAPVQRSRQPMPAKSPYDAPRPRSLRPSQSNVQGRISKVPSCYSSNAPSRQVSRDPRISNSQTARGRSPMVRKTSSNISTMMERYEKQGKFKTMPEKPLEDEPRANPTQESDLREILVNVAEEKISQMLAPFLEQLKITQQSMLESPKFKPREKNVEEVHETPRQSKSRVTSEVSSRERFEKAEEVPKVSRVTSEVSSSREKLQQLNEHPPSEPKLCDKTLEKVEKISKNVQYIYVKSEDEESRVKPVKSQQNFNTAKSQFTASKSQSSLSKSHEIKSPQAQPKPPIPFGNTSKPEDEIYSKKMKALAIKERLGYIEQQSQNPLYVNEACEEPWKLVSKISDRLVLDAMEKVLENVDFGEVSFVEKFLRSELKL